MFWFFVYFQHHYLWSCITLQLWLGTTAYLEVPRGSEQCQEDYTGENFVHKIAVLQIDLEWWSKKAILTTFMLIWACRTSFQSTWRLIWGLCLIWVQLLTYFLGSITLLTCFPYINKDTQNYLNPEVLGQLVFIFESEWKKLSAQHFVLIRVQSSGKLDTRHH